MAQRISVSLKVGPISLYSLLNLLRYYMNDVPRPCTLSAVPSQLIAKAECFCYVLFPHRDFISGKYFSEAGNSGKISSKKIRCEARRGIEEV